MVTSNLETRLTGDIDLVKLRNELAFLPSFLEDSHPGIKKLTSMDCFVDCLSLIQLFSEVIKLVKLYLTVPLSNTTAERSLSTLRRVKAYLRSCMTQEHINHFVMLHGHKDFTDRVYLLEIARLFVGVNQRRQIFFWKF